MEEYTEFIPFCGWYKCRACGVNEMFVFPQCPVCKRIVSNYEQMRTEALKDKLNSRLEGDHE